MRAFHRADEAYDAVDGDPRDPAVGRALEPGADGGAGSTMHGEEGAGGAPGDHHVQGGFDVARVKHAGTDDKEDTGPGRPAADTGGVGDDLLYAAGDAATPGGAAQSALDEVEDGTANGADQEDYAPALDVVQ